jgi:hypothetical protein
LEQLARRVKKTPEQYLLDLLLQDFKKQFRKDYLL